MRSDANQNVGEPRLRIHVVHLRGLCRPPNYAESGRFPQISRCPAFGRFGIVRPVPPLSIAENRKMEIEEYLDRSRLYQRLRSGPHGQLVERYAARLVEEKLVRHSAWRCLNVAGGLLSWIAGHRYKLVDLNEQVVERHLRNRGRRPNPVTGPRSSDGCRCCAGKARSRRAPISCTAISCAAVSFVCNWLIKRFLPTASTI